MKKCSNVGEVVGELKQNCQQKQFFPPPPERPYQLTVLSK